MDVEERAVLVDLVVSARVRELADLCRGPVAGQAHPARLGNRPRSGPGRALTIAASTRFDREPLGACQPGGDGPEMEEPV